MGKIKKIRERHMPDLVLLGIVSFLVVWGIFTVGTISFPFSLEKYGQPWYYLLHQATMLMAGIVLGIVCFKMRLSTLKKLAPYLFLANLVLIGLIILPKIGMEISGGRRWLNLGKFLFQPSEFLKITFILYLAAWLSERMSFGKSTDQMKKRKLKTRDTLFPFIIILAILVAALLYQSDMTTLVILCLIGVGMYFAAATPFWHTVLLLIAGLGGGSLLIKFKSYRLARLSTFLNPGTDPLGRGYQSSQAAITLGSGKIMGIEQGLALGLSRQKFGFLPHPMTDSIFAIIGEELGFIGATVLIMAFLFLAWKGLKIAITAENNFGKFLGFGIVVWLLSQTFLNIGGITGIMPLGGIPLPFFSYGGSHLIAEMMGVGIILNISKHSNL